MKTAVLALICMASPLWTQQAQTSFVFQPSPVVTPVAPTPSATMNQIINRLNYNQLQINSAAAQNAAQRPIFLPQQVTIKPAK